MISSISKAVCVTPRRRAFRDIASILDGLQNGLIAPAVSPWASNVLWVKKKDDSYRLSKDGVLYRRARGDHGRPSVRYCSWQSQQTSGRKLLSPGHDWWAGIEFFVPLCMQCPCLAETVGILPQFVLYMPENNNGDYQAVKKRMILHSLMWFSSDVWRTEGHTFLGIG